MFSLDGFLVSFSRIQKSSRPSERLSNQGHTNNYFEYFKHFVVLSISFLGISNVVSHSITTYDPLQQLARTYIMCPPGAYILVQWTNTLQKRNTVKILYMVSSPLCPVRALRDFLSHTPSGKNLPLLQIKSHGFD